MNLCSTVHVIYLVFPFYLFYFTIDHKSVKTFLTTKNLFLSKIDFLFCIFQVLKSSKYLPVVPAVFSLFLLTRRTYAYWRIQHHMWVSGGGGFFLPIYPDLREMSPLSPLMDLRPAAPPWPLSNTPIDIILEDSSCISCISRIRKY